ncbi:MAG TPA: MarR family winged helix-turn-helix transcriptional regulator [Rhodothermales bacterium]|nr:MarR family winged helix-turn-helix transcriptional regulator [Rhodothermales bacterium]
MDSTSPVPHIGVGPLMRFAILELRSNIYSRVAEVGFDDIRSTHVTLFRWPGPDGRRPTQVAEDVQISKQRVRDLLRDLESLGYLELVPDPVDGRARLIRLTERGRRLHRATLEVQTAVEQEWSERVGSDRFAALMDILRQLVRSPGENGAVSTDQTR